MAPSKKTGTVHLGDLLALKCLSAHEIGTNLAVMLLLGEPFLTFYRLKAISSLIFGPKQLDCTVKGKNFEVRYTTFEHGFLRQSKLSIILILINAFLKRSSAFHSLHVVGRF